MAPVGKTWRGGLTIMTVWKHNRTWSWTENVDWLADLCEISSLCQLAFQGRKSGWRWLCYVEHFLIFVLSTCKLALNPNTPNPQNLNSYPKTPNPSTQKPQSQKLGLNQCGVSNLYIHIHDTITSNLSQVNNIWNQGMGSWVQSKQ